MCEENAITLMSYIEENAELRRSHNHNDDKGYETNFTQTAYTGMTVETTTCTNDYTTTCSRSEIITECTTNALATSLPYIPE